MLTVLVSKISVSQAFLQMQKLLTFFSKNIHAYAICNDQSFNDTLTNNIVSFEQLGLGRFIDVNGMFYKCHVPAGSRMMCCCVWRSVLICACLLLSVSPSSLSLGRAAVCDCGIPWTFLLPPFFWHVANRIYYFIYLD